MSTIAITTECVCDLPFSMLNEMRIESIYFNIQTDKGLFQDTTEISERNILEYMAGGEKKAHSYEPAVEDYVQMFRRNLEKYQEVLHICISAQISSAYAHAVMAKESMKEEGAKIHIFDSKHLSSGMGILVYKAAMLRDEGKNIFQIKEALADLQKRISTTFVTRNADYLYYNGKVKKSVRNLCHRFSIHPILYMKNGKLCLKSVVIGNYDKACLRYVNGQLRQNKDIDTELAFVTHAGCSQARLSNIKDQIKKYIEFEQLYLKTASATVSCNCGPDCFGVLFLRRK